MFRQTLVFANEQQIFLLQYRILYSLLCKPLNDLENLSRMISTIETKLKLRAESELIKCYKVKVHITSLTYPLII